MIAARGENAAQAFDQDAFIVLVEPVLPAAYRLAVAMLRSEIEAEDAVQEAVLNAWRHRDRFRAGADMKPWLLAIVANECRRTRRSRWWSVIRWPMVSQAGDSGPGSHEGLGRALQQLPHGERLVLALRYYLDLPFEDVARVLKTTPKAAKSRTYRALQRLRLNPEVIGDERD